MSDLREDLERLAPEVDVTGAWERVAAGIPRRRRQMAMRRAGVAVLAAGLAVVVGWVAMPGQESTPVVDTAIPSTSTPSPSTVPASDAASQSPEDAARDGVVSKLAEAPYESRVDPLVTVESPEGTWMLSELSDELLDSPVVEPGCRIGDPQGDPPAVCAHEYGEVLLIRDDAIARAFPFPGVPPSWLHVADGAVYAGRIGDGALPHSTIVRIERATLESSTVVFVHPDAASAPQMLSSWREATAAELDDLPDLVGFASAGMEGTDVESWVGDIRVNLEGVRRLFSESAALGSDGTEASTEEQPTEQGQPDSVDDEGFDVIADFVDAWKARDAAGMGQASASDLPESDIQWLIDLGTPAGEPYECRQWEDDDGPVAQCYIDIPDHGQYEQETHYVLARPRADGTWEVAWAAVLTQ